MNLLLLVSLQRNRCWMLNLVDDMCKQQHLHHKWCWTIQQRLGPAKQHIALNISLTNEINYYIHSLTVLRHEYSFVTSCYRVMLNIKSNNHIPNATIYTMTNPKSPLERVNSQHLKFHGYILRLPDWKHMPSIQMCQHMEDDILAASVPPTCPTYNARGWWNNIWPSQNSQSGPRSQWMEEDCGHLLRSWMMMMMTLKLNIIIIIIKDTWYSA